MTINKFTGKTKEEAIEKARKQFGANAVIMNVREVKPKGLFGAFQKPTFEVTAAMEEKENYVSPLKALMSSDKTHDNINLAADEPIRIPRPPRMSIQTNDDILERKASKIEGNLVDAQLKKDRELAEAAERRKTTLEEKKIEERLDNLSSILEERLGIPKADEAPAPAEPEPREKAISSEEFNLMRIIYSTLVRNEVNEKYVNQLMDEMEQLVRPGNSVDTILSNVYQKLILRFGQPDTIAQGGRKPRVIFFIGPTGVGKTTTIAKIASTYKVDHNKKIAFITADTYRIAATEQLRVYANILDAPMSIVYEAKELNEAVEALSEYELIFVDTAGFSHKNGVQCEDMEKLIGGLDEAYEREVYLVLSATTKYRDLLDIVDIYKEISDFKLIFTKLDETSRYGNILNIRLYSQASLSYVTDGQNVPDDIEVFDSQKIVKQLLGGGKDGPGTTA